jgi:protocatechuate 3,4-dioxygenase beta subunit
MNRGTARPSPGRPQRRAPGAVAALVAAAVGGVLVLFVWLLNAPERGPRATGLTRADALLGAPSDGPRAVLEAGAFDGNVARAEAPRELDLAAAGLAASELAGLVPGRFEVRALEGGTRRPIEGATVTVRRGEAPPVTAETDDGGRAVLEAPFSAGDLLVASTRHVDVARAAVLAGTEHVLELAPSGALAGRVEFKGRAALGTPEVRLWSRERGRGGRPDRTTPLESNGTFRFEDLAPGFVTVALAAEDVPLVHEPSVAIRAGEEAFVTLRAPAPQRVVGRVVDAADQRPLAGVAVHARPEAQGTPNTVTELGRTRATTGLDGSFVLEPLACGRHMVIAETAWGARTEREVLVSETPTEALELRLAPPITVEGRVVDDAGRAVAHATVAVIHAEALRQVNWGRVLAAPPLEQGEARGRREQDERVLARATSDAAGRFLLDSLPADTRLAVVAVELQGNGTREGSAEVRPRRANAPREPVLVTLRGSNLVAGQVLDEAGAPIKGASVEVEARDSARRLIGSVTRTDDDGRFTVAADAERDVELRVRADGFRNFGANLALAPAPGGGRVFAEPIVLARELRVSGLVRDEDGNGLRASVRLSSYDAGGAERQSVGAFSDSYGRFTVGGLAHGTWYVSARASGHRALAPPREDPTSGLAVEVPATAPLEIVLARAPLEPRGAVSGELVALGTDDAVPGLRFDGLGRGALLFEGARFRAVGLAVGKARFVVTAPGFETTTLPEVDIVADRSTDLGRVELRPATELIVRVEDAAGQPVRGADVRLDRLPPERAGRGGLPGRLAVPAVRGGSEHRLANTPRARWRLVVNHAQSGRYRAELEVTGPAQQVTARLVPR